MLANKLTISQETLNKNELNSAERNIKYWKRIKELDASGELQKINNRQQLMQSMGAMPEDKRAYNFVGNRISSKHMKEILVGYENGKAVYEYHLTNKTPRFDPDYKGKRKVKRNRQAIKPTEVKETKPVVTLASYITMARGDVTIEIPMSAENVEKLVLKLWLGE